MSVLQWGLCLLPPLIYCETDKSGQVAEIFFKSDFFFWLITYNCHSPVLLPDACRWERKLGLSHLHGVLSLSPPTLVLVGRCSCRPRSGSTTELKRPGLPNTVAHGVCKDGSVSSHWGMYLQIWLQTLRKNLGKWHLKWMYVNEDQMDKSACGSADVSRSFLLQTCIVLAVSVQADYVCLDLNTPCLQFSFVSLK